MKQEKMLTTKITAFPIFNEIKDNALKNSQKTIRLDIIKGMLVLKRFLKNSDLNI